MTTDEQKEIELRAYGKRISFHTRHHWILTWLEEQPGKNLADRVFGVIDRAYRAHYAEVGRAALNRYWSVLDIDDLSPALDALNEAIDAFNRAGMETQGDIGRDLLRSVLAAMSKRAA